MSGDQFSKELSQLRTLAVPFVNKLLSTLTALEKTVAQQNERIATLEKANNIEYTPSPAVNSGEDEKAASISVTSEPSPKKSDSNGESTKAASEEPTKPAKKLSRMERMAERERIAKERKEKRMSKSPGPAGGAGAKLHPNEKKLRWMFKDHPIVAPADNGQSANKPQFKCGSVRFGNFMSKSQDLDGSGIKGYIVVLETSSAGANSGVGFGWQMENFNAIQETNFGDNNSAYIKGNGQFYWSKGFGDKAQHKEMQEGFKAGVFSPGDFVAMKVDFEQMEGSVWNLTRNDGNVFTIKLPNKPIAFMVYLGGSQKRKMVIEKQILFK